MTTSVSSSTSSDSTTSSSSSSVSSSSSTSDDLEVQFIDLLVAEIENQDPTDPMDASEYVSQLSQLSMVQGIDDLNDTATSTNDTLNDMSLTAATDLVGKEVTVPADSITVDESGATVSGQVTLDSAADSVTVNLYDSSGTLVSQSTYSNQSAGTVEYSFENVDSGDYTITATSTTGSTSTTLTTYVTDTVDKVSLSDDAVELEVSGIGTVSLSNVVSVSNG